jgi:phosphate transport system substrate-binding protein
MHWQCSTLVDSGALRMRGVRLGLVGTFLLMLSCGLAFGQTQVRTIGGEIDIHTLVGKQVRVRTVTGAVWNGVLEEVTSDRIVVRGAGGRFTVPVDAIQNIEEDHKSGSGGGQRPAEGQLRIHGSNTIGAQLMPNLLEAFAADSRLSGIEVTESTISEEKTIKFGGAETDRQIVVDLHSHGTATAFTDLAARAADLGMASRKVKQQERDAVQRAGRGDLFVPGQENVIALDGLAIIVNRTNPIASLQLNEITEIFSGAVTNWSKLGGSHGPINLYSRDEKSGTFDTFNELVLRGRPLARGARLFQDSRELSNSVANDPNAIGFIGLAYIGDAKPLNVGVACGITAPLGVSGSASDTRQWHQQSEFGIGTEEYPLSRRLYIYRPSDAGRLADDLVNFAISAKAQPVVAAADFVNLSPKLADRSYGEVRSRTAANAYGNADDGLDNKQASQLGSELRGIFAASNRLSITFRFQNNSDALDSRAEADIGRLVQWSKESENSGRHVVLVGYSSSVGSFGPNVTLARSRANIVAQRLRDRGVQPARVLGVGPISAVACNAEEAGQALNRRVEVWVR